MPWPKPAPQCYRKDGGTNNIEVSRGKLIVGRIGLKEDDRNHGERQVDLAVGGRIARRDCDAVH